MNDAEWKARKAAVDFVNAHFTDLESLDKVKDVCDDIHRAHEASRQQLEEQVNDSGLRTGAVHKLSNAYFGLL